MASEDRSKTDDLTWLERLERDAGSFDFHVALRRFECAFSGKPRLGEAVRPADEPLRIGQEPALTFAPTAMASFSPATETGPARLSVAFLGLWGPMGPLPMHLTEYARDRVRHAGDMTLARFIDVFHHRMMLMFHRAWSKTQPTVAMDRPLPDAFAGYLGAFLGLGLDATRNRDAFPDRAKLYYASHFARSSRNAEGLREIIADYFQVPTAIEEFVGDWLELPAASRWNLGVTAETGTLGKTAVLGTRVWTRAHKFRIVLGPLSAFDAERSLPSSQNLATMAALVRTYTNDEWAWDLRLVLAPEATERMQLGRGARLGWTTRIGQSPGVREDLVVDPVLRRTHRVQRKTARA
jgi:type VI secretion system protein ImpH